MTKKILTILCAGAMSGALALGCGEESRVETTTTAPAAKPTAGATQAPPREMTAEEAMDQGGMFEWGDEGVMDAEEEELILEDEAGERELRQRIDEGRQDQWLEEHGPTYERSPDQP